MPTLYLTASDRRVAGVTGTAYWIEGFLYPLGLTIAPSSHSLCQRHAVLTMVFKTIRRHGNGNETTQLVTE